MRTRRLALTVASLCAANLIPVPASAQGTWRVSVDSAGAHPALLATIDVNGAPLFLSIVLGSSDGLGLWSFSATVPPGLAGNVVTFRAFGVAPTGKLDLTNGDSVTFQ